jgi:hypothetical protein
MPVLSEADMRGVHQSLETDGYAVIRNVVSKGRLTDFDAMLSEEYERAMRAGLFKGGGTVSGHLNCFPGVASRFIYDEIAEKGIVDLVRALDPTMVEDVRPTLNYNLPGSVAQFYHMDGIYTQPFLICNVAVVDTDIANGAIDLLPGTNRRFYRFCRYAVERKYRLTTRVSMEQGDVLLRMSTLWHRGMPNTTCTPRPMMSLTFGEGVGGDGDRFMMNGGGVEFYANWYKTDRLGQLRERVFVTAPWTDSAFRFGRSLFSNKGYSSW